MTIIQTRNTIQRFCVTAAQMQAIEKQIFAVGFPIAALMEKVAARIVTYGQHHWLKHQRIGVLAGPGHNGGDALVVARELFLQGYEVIIYSPFERCKPLTEGHGRYCRSLGIPWYQTDLEAILGQCHLVLDGLFGFGLNRPLVGALAADVESLNRHSVTVVSIDLPSGLHTDTGEVLGTAVHASTTLCLGLWKQAFLQETAQPYLGETVLIDFDIPLANIEQVLGTHPQVQRLTDVQALQALPLHRSPVAHKYTVGHLLLIAGSRQYMGAALLAGHGAMASGVGMITLVVPDSVRHQAIAQLPGALVMGVEESAQGTIATLPALNFNRYDAIACGPGLAQVPWLTQVLDSAAPLLLDADGLNGITAHQLSQRSGLTVITPHPGEFKRLFPDVSCNHAGALTAAQQTNITVVLKGSKVTIATPDGRLWLNPSSTPALARGGSGDVLTGLMGGLMAQNRMTADAAQAVISAALGAVWWHAQAGIYAHRRRTVLGVDPLELSRALNPALAECQELLSEFG
ncbi:MAG: NAD(P)H-hydrate dehydratase [Cyanobacteria bacterium P01_D01_bin.156]